MCIRDRVPAQVRHSHKCVRTSFALPLNTLVLMSVFSMSSREGSWISPVNIRRSTIDSWVSPFRMSICSQFFLVLSLTVSARWRLHPRGLHSRFHPPHGDSVTRRHFSWWCLHGTTTAAFPCRSGGVGKLCTCSTWAFPGADESQPRPSLSLHPCLVGPLVIERFPLQS